jgi:uncharacterized protein YdhG (YjbR/CyaY superfamily)
MGTAFKTMDDYLAALSEDKRAALEHVRQVVRAAVPQAQECISYKLPAFRLNGKCFLWMGAAAKHCAIYGIVDSHMDELKAYDSSGKGTVRFTACNPLPSTLIRKLAKAQVSSIIAK